jgi:hypothetical protein
LKSQRSLFRRKHTAIIDFDDNVYICGSNKYTQLGLDNNHNKPVKIPNIKAKEVSIEHRHAAIMSSYNNISTFGSNFKA